MEDSTAGAPGRVLVVDDEPLNRKLIRSFLDLEGIEVIEANDAESGLALARSQSPGLILLDLQLPGMSGLEALAALKRDDATREIPVVILSAGSLERDTESLREAGAAGLLLKPFSGKELLERVRAFLR
ncbi:MAG: response regulator [Spirochaetales bacterium]|nr:response regulator [Spirochaetales bacterium]